MSDVTFVVGVITALVLANALFVAAEFAIVGALRAAIEHAASQGSRLAQRVARILHDPRRQDRFIATTQVGISIASVGLGMYGEHVLAETLAGWFAASTMLQRVGVHAVAGVVSIACLTYLHIVVGEMVPKALALQRAARTVQYVTPAIQTMQLVLHPLVVALNAIGNAILRRVGVQREEGAERYHTTEIGRAHV